MIDIEHIKHYLRTLPIDARVEIILADLLAKGISIDDIIIQPIGLFKRSFHRDIDEVKALDIVRNQKEKLIISLNRQGLYDALPEGLFHQPIFPGQKEKENVLKEIRAQRQRENAARKFFLPIEQEYYRLRLILELEENKYFVTPNNINRHEVLQQFWEIPSFLSAQQICTMLYLLPIAYKIVGDFRLTELCFEAILNTPVSIKNTFPLRHNIVLTKPQNTKTEEENPWDAGLGSMAMGSDFVLSGGEYQETIPAIMLNLGPMPAGESAEYFEATLGTKIIKGERRQVLDYLIDNFLPFEADTIVHISPPTDLGLSCALSSQDATEGSLMGFDSYL